ncbi:hypothetical protein NIES4073_38700 [Kalymmatonema gypsitolerans NIES-4073]|nr:hypothetical protein NIES4073_38700 [Scytonema sp. NIES-4073]
MKYIASNLMLLSKYPEVRDKLHPFPTELFLLPLPLCSRAKAYGFLTKAKTRLLPTRKGGDEMNFGAVSPTLEQYLILIR